jgi:hypothetical protein
MKTFNVFKRIAKTAEKTLVGQFQAGSKKEICAKVASLNNGFFISATEVNTTEVNTTEVNTTEVNTTKVNTTKVNTTEQNFENMHQAYFESRFNR